MSHVKSGHVRLDLVPVVHAGGDVIEYDVFRGGCAVGTARALGAAGWSLRLRAHPELTWSWPTAAQAAESAALWLTDRERSEGVRLAAARGQIT